MKKVRLLLAMLVMAGMAATSQAGVTFVDATYDNTTAVDGTDPWYGGRTPPIWRDRNGDFGVFTADEDAYPPNNDYLMIKTTITGLTPDQPYNVYLFFNGFRGWSIMGGLSEAAVEGFSDVNRTIGANDHTGADDASGRVVHVGGGYQDATYRALLGVTTANAAGEIAVFIDDPDNSNPAGSIDQYRCWYDGVGYEVIPEPATLALLGLGGLGLLRRRK